MDISTIENAAKHFVSGAASAVGNAVGGTANAIGPIDLVKVEQIVLDIIQAAPAIQAAEQSALPYIQAIVALIQNGGSAPTDEQWAELRGRLDAGSAALQNAANEPDPNAEPGLSLGGQ
jgi:hypothetical protein